jgi:hypothetical protein
MSGKKNTIVVLSLVCNAMFCSQGMSCNVVPGTKILKHYWFCQSKSWCFPFVFLLPSDTFCWAVNSFSDMYITSIVSSLKLQLVLILSRRNYRLMTSWSLCKWVKNHHSILFEIKKENILQAIIADIVYVICVQARYGTQQGRRGFRV